jgi:hypothetical protein
MNQFLYKVKLFIWWNFKIKKNEFHPSLDYFQLYEKFKNKYTTEEIQYITVFQRNLAQELDTGTNIRDIDVKLIKRAKI